MLLILHKRSPDLILLRVDADGLSDQDLSEAYLAGALMEGLDCSRIILRAADLRGAVLRRAVLCAADLREADLRGADLADGDLTDADLTGAWYDEETLWPDGISPADRGALRWDASQGRKGGTVDASHPGCGCAGHLQSPPRIC